MTRHVSQIGGDLSPDAHSPALGELFKDGACRVFVELATFQGGSTFNPLWVKAAISSQVDFHDRDVTEKHTETLAGSIVNIMNCCFPIIPNNELGATFSLVVGLVGTYDQRDTLSSKEIAVSIFDQFFGAANFLAARAIPAYDGWPSHLVTFGIMIGEDIYLLHTPKNQEATDREMTSITIGEDIYLLHTPKNQEAIGRVMTSIFSWLRAKLDRFIP